MITREKEPPNIEMPFGTLDQFITPTEHFYVRCHFPVPDLDERIWRLRIEGSIERPIEFSYDEIRALPQRTITATIECAGNGRVFLVPKVKGVPWELGAVGNAEWTGVSLADVLVRAGVKATTREVILEGADCGSIAEPPRPAGKIHFARSLPIKKALDDVLLAYAMNGQPLPPAHGFPLRAVVPGWYGMASVKWLTRIVAITQPFHGYYQSVDYGYWKSTAGGPTLVPLAQMQLKAQIARPENQEVVAAESTYRIKGAAWTGEGEIERVEVSVDGGGSWRKAKLKGKAVVNAWRLWELDWRTPETPGACTLFVRAIDAEGRVQAAERDANGGTYMISHSLPVEVEVA